MYRKKIIVTALASAAALISFGAPASAQADDYGNDDTPPVTTLPADYGDDLTPPVVTIPVTVAVDPTTLLPTTGSDGNGTMILVAASLLGAGGVMTVASRSRRTA